MNDYYQLTNPSEEDSFAFTEAMDYLIRKTKKPEYMMRLGGYYYEQKRFDLALKYYEMAAELGDIDAIICLGYIWYYGRTGTRDFEKAFNYFSAGQKAGDLQSAYKVADMYKNGYFVEKDYGKYCAIIEELYPKVISCSYLSDPLPEVFTRLARIRMEQERYDEAEELLWRAKDFLAQRIRYHSFFGDLNIMKWLEEDMERLDAVVPDLYSLFVILKKPAVVTFGYKGKHMQVESMEEDGELVIRFHDKWFRTVDDFFSKAEIDGELLTTLYDKLYDWEVQDGDH